MDPQSGPALWTPKKRRDRLKALAVQQQDWLLVDQDESWFSRFAHPALHTWAEKGHETRQVERVPGKKEPDKALSCFGAVCQETNQRYLFFAGGQPNTDHTILMIERLVDIAQNKGKRVLALVWDRASWHQSHQLKRWLRAHNQKTKLEGGVRIITCLLPVKSPWLNPMEPIWLHSKRKVDEPDGNLSVDELKARLCALFNTDILSATLK